jgi:L-amino acid N-acyltransferase YncA
MHLRPAVQTDLPALQRIFDAVIAPGDTYVFDRALDQHEFRDYWFGQGVSTFVCEDAGDVLGMYKLVANRRDRGSHVANASFMVAPEARGRGVGRRLGEDCLAQARVRGFRAMQFNFVVSTNAPAVALWKSLGFAVVATLPGAFRHEQLGFVDALVMFRTL